MLYNLGKWAGLFGFVSLSFLIFFGDTARIFDRFFGLDKIIKFERKFALITMFFVFFHPVFFILSSGSIKVYLIPNFSILPLAVGIMSFYLFFIVLVCSPIYKRISNTVWQYIHILTYILFFMSLYHANNWGSNSDLFLFKTIYVTSLSFIILGIIYRTYYKIKKFYSEKFYIKKVQQETHDTFTIILRSKKKMNFQAGQFCFLRLNKNRLYARHPFSISSSPQESDLHFTIKQTGKFTKVASELQKNEEINIEGPFGVFNVRDDKKDLVFIAGGVGITPFLSIIKDHINRKQKQNIILLYGSQKEEDIIFKNKLDNIKEDWFKKVYILNKEKILSEKYEFGYVDKNIIEKYIKNIDNTLFYICGPKVMKNSVKKILFDLKVKRRDIFIEDFFW